jgi:hypothetical protein
LCIRAQCPNACHYVGGLELCLAAWYERQVSLCLILDRLALSSCSVLVSSESSSWKVQLCRGGEHSNRSLNRNNVMAAETALYSVWSVIGRRGRGAGRGGLNVVVLPSRPEDLPSGVALMELLTGSSPPSWPDGEPLASCWHGSRRMQCSSRRGMPLCGRVWRRLFVRRLGRPCWMFEMKRVGGACVLSSSQQSESAETPPLPRAGRPVVSPSESAIRAIDGESASHCCGLEGCRGGLLAGTDSGSSACYSAAFGCDVVGLFRGRKGGVE